MPLSSEVSGLINFFVCELFIMGYVLFITTVIAGALNHQATNKGGELQFVVFDLPHVGGGLVMNRGISRTVLILLRLATLIAVTVSSFGLEGRSKVTTTTRTGVVRRPGLPPLRSYEDFFEVTELQKRCAQTDNGRLIFGSVINGTCYPTVTDHVYIRSLSLSFEVFNFSARDCLKTENETFHYTTYHCTDCDIACFGISQLEFGRCKSLLYESESVAWICPSFSAMPNVTNQVHCQRLEASTKDIKEWMKVYKLRTEDVETAVFGAAYGFKETKTVAVPDRQQNVTSVTLFWIIPVLVEIMIVIVTTVWAISLRYGTGAFPIAHDERSLSRLLRHYSDLGDRKVTPTEYRRAIQEVQAVAFRTQQPSQADDLT